MIVVITENNKPVDAFYKPEEKITYQEKVVKIEKDSLVAKAFMMKGELENAKTVS